MIKLSKDFYKGILIGLILSTLFYSYYPDSTLYELNYGVKILSFESRESFLSYDIPGVVVNVEHLGFNRWTDIYLISYVEDSKYHEYGCKAWGNCKND